ncbi:hypothetical protein [Rhodococcus sp. BE178]
MEAVSPISFSAEEFRPQPTTRPAELIADMPEVQFLEDWPSGMSRHIE